MFERMTDRSRRVVVLSQEESRLMCHNNIGTGHLLLGMVHEAEGLAAGALLSLGVNLDQAREFMLEFNRMGYTAPEVHRFFTSNIKKVFDQAVKEAVALQANYIGTEHLLLASISPSITKAGEDPNTAVKILRKFGLSLDDVRQATLEKIAKVQSYSN